MPEGAQDGEREQLYARLLEIQQELMEIQRRLGTGDEPGQESPEQRRRRFIVLPGGLAGIAALVTAAPAWARRHGRTLTAGVAGAAGGAAITAAAIGAPAPPPHASAPPPPAIAPTATTLTPSAQNRPRPHRSLLPPPVIATGRRRPSPTPPAAAPSGAPPEPEPSPAGVPTQSPTPARTTPQPGPDPSCLILLEAGRIIHVCL